MKNIYALIGFKVTDDPEIENHFDYCIVRFKPEGGFYVANVILEKTKEMQFGEWNYKINRWNPVLGYNNLLMLFQENYCNGAVISQVKVCDNQVTEHLSGIDIVKNYDELVSKFQVICEKINDGFEINEPKHIEFHIDGYLQQEAVMPMGGEFIKYLTCTCDEYNMPQANTPHGCKHVNKINSGNENG